MFLVLYVRKYSKLTKFIQKIDPNSRMPRIFMDSIDKSAFYVYTNVCFHVLFCYDLVQLTLDNLFVNDQGLPDFDSVKM